MPAVTAKQPIQSLCGAMQSASERFSSPRVWLRSIASRRSRPFWSVIQMSSPSARAGKIPTAACSVSSRSSRMRASRASGVGEDLARFGAFFGVVEDFGIASLETPCREEEAPVDIGFGVGDVEVGEDHAAGVQRLDGQVRGGAFAGLADLDDRNQVPGAFGAQVVAAQRLLVGADLVGVQLAVGTEQLRQNLAVAGWRWASVSPIPNRPGQSSRRYAGPRSSRRR